MIIFVFSDAILKQNSLKITSGDIQEKGEFGALVNWLPKEAKITIEYRARSLFLQNRIKRTKDKDEKVVAIFDFATYIEHRDPKGCDNVLYSVIKDPAYSQSRNAYLVYTALLLKKGRAHTITIDQLKAYLKTLKWPEDQYQAWEKIQKQIKIIRPSNQDRLNLFSFLIDNPPPHYKNFSRFFKDLAVYAKQGKNIEAEKEAVALQAQYDTYSNLSSALLKASTNYRNTYQDYQNMLSEAKTPQERLVALTNLASHTRAVDPQESAKFFDQIFDTPAYHKLPEFYNPASYLLLYSKNKHSLSISEYHKLLEDISDPRMLFEAWDAGYQQLVRNKNKTPQILEYLEPLLHLKKEYVEYAEFFRILEGLGLETNDTELFNKASDFLIRVQEIDMPSLFLSKEEQMEDY